MTIGVGFLCSDGIVICADRQMTGEGGYKFEGSKISTSQKDECSIVYTYAGDPDAGQMMFEKSEVALRQELGNSSEFDDVAGAAQRTLERVYKDRQSKNLQSLFGILACGQQFLIKTNESKVVRGNAYCIGYGDSSVIRYVCDLLLSTRFSVNEADVVASYLVSVAGRYIQFCGERVGRAVLRPDGGLVEGHGGPWFDHSRERFIYCEQEIGRGLRELLFSGGTRAIEVVEPKGKSNDH